MKTKQSITEVKIVDIMTSNVETLSPGDTIQDAVRLMVEFNITTVPVVNFENKCVGILSRSDLTEMFMEEDSELSRVIDMDRLSLEWLHRSLDTGDSRQVKELMTYEVKSIRDDQNLIAACRLMAELHIHHLPVVDANDSVVGIVSAFDVVNAVARS